MARLFPVVALSLLILIITSFCTLAGATWCVARSDATEQALQTALDYACGSGADCVPIQAEGLCFLPNSMQAHASYAYNSYYQRRGNAPGSCDFSGTATVAKTDPSYGSCVYPASPSQAGGSIGIGTGSGNGTGTTTPSLSTPPPPGTAVPLYGNSLTPPGLGIGTEAPLTSNSRKTTWDLSRKMAVVYIIWTCFFWLKCSFLV